MKKAIIAIVTFIVFIIIYLLQANFFSWFTIAGIKPNLFIILVLFIGLFAGKYVGVSAGVIFGLCIDLFISKKIGISAIMLGIVGILGGYLDKNFSKESRMTIMIMVMGTTLVYELGLYLINTIIFSANMELNIFCVKVIIEILYNTILTIILYPLLQRAGVYIEEAFKGTKILTRYF